jgi:hypothetical protein
VSISGVEDFVIEVSLNDEHDTVRDVTLLAWLKTISAGRGNDGKGAARAFLMTDLVKHRVIPQQFAFQLHASPHDLEEIGSMRQVNKGVVGRRRRYRLREDAPSSVCRLYYDPEDGCFSRESARRIADYWRRRDERKSEAAQGYDRELVKRGA